MGVANDVRRITCSYRKLDAQHLERLESVLGAMQQNDLLYRVQYYLFPGNRALP